MPTYKTNGMFAQLIKSYKNLSVWPKVTIFLAILFIIVGAIQAHRPAYEGFIQKEKFIFKTGPEIFDDFYVSVYDKLLFSRFKNKFEIGEIMNKTSPTEESMILDINSGPGHQVNTFTQKGISTIGLDTRANMLKQAKKQYPKCQFKSGNPLNTVFFQPDSFTHILCLNFAIYDIKNKKLFFENCLRWLVPGGNLVLHVVDKEKFNPIVPRAHPFLISPQKYADKRITKSSVKFREFQYKNNFELNKNNLATITETFKDDKTGHVRKNEHKLFMEPHKEIIQLAQNVGFTIQNKVEMKFSKYENQFIYILKKPN